MVCSKKATKRLHGKVRSKHVEPMSKERTNMSIDNGIGNFGSLVRVVEPEDKKIVSKKPMKRTSTTLHESRSRPSTVNNKDHKDDQTEENGVWFWVNKNGFPIDDMTWQRMWDHVAKIHPDGEKMVATIRSNTNHPQVPFPQPPMTFSPSMPIADRLEKIQNYMNTLQYNHTGTQFFEIKKNRPVSGLMEVAKDMIRESLPIKCLEAIILGVFLTNGIMGMERFPLSFKTQFNGTVHRHVVLGIYHAGKYGALGMSRRSDLMYKPLTFKSLSDVVLDYERAYRQYWHEIKKIKVGLPISHDPHSYEFITWKSLALTRGRITQQELVKEVDMHAKEIRQKGKQRLDLRRVRTYLYYQSRSWSVPQAISPRKSLSFVDMDSVRHARSKGTHSSINQALKLYKAGTGTGIATKDPEHERKREPTTVTVPDKKETTNVADYQIRI